MDSYELLDSGHGRKLERLGRYTLARPCGQAVWRPLLSDQVWEEADGSFSREGGAEWHFSPSVPPSWTIEIDGMKMHLQPTDFGHVGVFFEQRPLWQKIRSLSDGAAVLNLFAYSGGSSIAAALGGASVCHLDASKGMVDWARENAALNGLSSIRWIVDDVAKFLKREERRGSKYDGIILDPPSFGRGSKGEVFKIEKSITALLESCRACLSDAPRFLLLSCHTPGFTPTTLQYLLEDTLGAKGTVESGEMVLSGPRARPIPSGIYALWRP